MNKDACFELGYIEKVHGVQGEIVAFFDVDDITPYQNIDAVLIEQQGSLVPFLILGLRVQQKNRIVLQLEDVEDRPAAELLKSAKLFLPLEALPELDEDQFYYHEIVGYKVKDADLGELGEITSIYDAGPQVLLAVDSEGTEILVPLKDEIVIQVDKKEQMVHTKLPDGLVEIYTDEPDEN